jgi:hypothetical protein
LPSPTHSGARLTALASIPSGPSHNQPETWCAALLRAQTDVGKHEVVSKATPRSRPYRRERAITRHKLYRVSLQRDTDSLYKALDLKDDISLLCGHQSDAGCRWLRT